MNTYCVCGHRENTDLVHGRDCHLPAEHTFDANWYLVRS